jgi:5-(aminomethyl)-3-furanmethanol phosphate kinase
LTVTVIKLGGSLMYSDELSAWLNSIESYAQTSNVIVVPGGGEFADLVRQLQKTHGFDDYIAHQMALLAMSQYGHYLAGINSKFRIVDDIDSISSSLGKSAPLIWLPLALVGDNSKIAASWDFTSDSIALWLATELGAEKLILVKSVDLSSTKLSLREHINNCNIDNGFHTLRNNYSGEIYFMHKSQYSYLTDPLNTLKDFLQPDTV